ncbi:ATP-binding protein [Cellulomonas sp. SLBN-39]|uniref:ATP-binding protein n=1 Tax=Cellulomonas sp. SLBN-39 TaxID=2768446 RepID=UPI001152A503|nr:DUF4143 domain-containing protein [Cellulomonas sp. SLBN-39]TQL03210.1 hypothetical protein FBY24_2304 [Cellulomonas sp. SLBN-39]
MSPAQTSYRSRVVDAQLDEYLAELPAVAIDGPKGVGKTATASRRARTVLRLDDEADRGVVEADPARLSRAEPPVLVDEWQRLPVTWDVVRRAVDDGADAGAFLLTGSASPETPQTHSGAGRIVTLRMRPLTLPERGWETPSVSLAGLLAGRARIEGATSRVLEHYVDALIGGGFPGMQHVSPRPRRALLEGYVDRIVDRDFPEAGREVRNPAGLRRWMRALAAASGTSASYETIRDAASAGHTDPPSRATTQPYRDTLERIWVYDPVPAWDAPSGAGLSRLVSSPKHFLADPALAAVLLDMDAEALIRGDDGQVAVQRDGTLLGGLFESLVALSLRVFAQAADARVSHLRTRGGEHEVDFLVEGRGRRLVAVEVKLASAPTARDVRHLLWLKDQLGDALTDMLLVTTGREAYRRPDGIAVVPLALLGP